MARKVFISVLGTGYYGECVYQRDGFASSPTRFIQQATLEMLTQGGEWTAADGGYVLLTEQARSTNWHIPGGMRKNMRTKADESYMGLESVLKGMNLPFEVSGIDIPVGKNEEEIWQIFDIVYGVLQDGDELYFDLTHGFRYLPMLVLVLGNYAKFLKHVKVCSITYGNFETRSEDGKAPIIDITPLSTLQDWTAASADYLRHGDSTMLGICGTQQLSPILKETRGKDEAAQNLRKLIASLNAYTDDMRFCRGMALIGGKQAADINACLGKVGDQYLKPFRPLFAMIRDTVADMNTNHAANMLTASAQCYRYGNLQAAITLLEEGVVSLFCERHGLPVDDAAQREAVNKAFKKKDLRATGKLAGYRPSAAPLERVIDAIEQDPLLTDGLVNAFSNLSDVRNDINHAGMRNNKQPLKVKKIDDNIKKVLEAVMDVATDADKCAVRPMCADAAATPESQHLPSLFINLSNHPSTTWTDEQLAAAKAFGEIVDMSFPQVAPDATAADIDKLADAQVATIMQQATTHTVTAHVMGEMSLIYRIVRKLSAHGIRCVCSTSRRVVKDEGDGKRLVEFNFCSFRDYE